MIAIVVAEAHNHVIGKQNDLPWYLPADLKHFKEITTGHSVIMGRKTYESIYSRLKGPLPQRQNIVISRSLQDIPEGFELAHSLEDAMQLAKGYEQIFLIGGSAVFEEGITQKLVDRIYLTQIDANIEGDTYFPELDLSQWNESAREDHDSDEKNQYPYTFITLDRVKETA